MVFCGFLLVGWWVGAREGEKREDRWRELVARMRWRRQRLMVQSTSPIEGGRVGSGTPIEASCTNLQQLEP